MYGNTSRTQSIVNNCFWALLNFFIMAILGLVTRKVFVKFFRIEFLGLNGLFSNLLGWFSLAELGIGSVISYNLYRELREKNINEINIWMSIYKSAYLVVAAVVSILGIFFLFLLQFLIDNNNININYVRIVYIIQLAGNVSSYFLAYRRILFICDQKEFNCIKVDIISSLLASILRIIAIVYLHSFIVFSLVALFQNVCANWIIFNNCVKQYPFLKIEKITHKDIVQRNIFKDVKNLLIQKLSLLAYNNTDNIIISYFLGLKVTGMVANYVFVIYAIQQLLYAIMKGILPSVGNLVNSENKEHVLNVFNALDIFYFILGTLESGIIIICLQQFINLFFGLDYLLPFGYVIGISIEKHIVMQFETVYNFRSAMGLFEQDRKWSFFSAIANIALSILLVKKLGIVGVITGTIIAFAFIACGRVFFVFRNILIKESLFKYLVKHILWTVVSFAEIVFVLLVLSLLPDSSWGYLFLRFVLSLIFILFLQILMFIPFRAFSIFSAYFINFFHKK